jgi:hypothetical protein
MAPLYTHAEQVEAAAAQENVCKSVMPSSHAAAMMRRAKLTPEELSIA